MGVVGEWGLIGVPSLPWVSLGLRVLLCVGKGGGGGVKRVGVSVGDGVDVRVGERLYGMIGKEGRLWVELSREKNFPPM